MTTSKTKPPRGSRELLDTLREALRAADLDRADNRCAVAPEAKAAMRLYLGSWVCGPLRAAIAHLEGDDELADSHGFPWRYGGDEQPESVERFERVALLLRLDALEESAGSSIVMPLRYAIADLDGDHLTRAAVMEALAPRTKHLEPSVFRDAFYAAVLRTEEGPAPERPSDAMAVLDFLAANGSRTAAALARESGLSRATIDRALGFLCAHHWLNDAHYGGNATTWRARTPKERHAHVLQLAYRRVLADYGGDASDTARLLRLDDADRERLAAAAEAAAEAWDAEWSEKGAAQ